MPRMIKLVTQLIRVAAGSRQLPVSGQEKAGMLNLDRRTVDLIDHFVPREIWRGNPTPVTIARARILVAVLCSSIVVPAVVLALVGLLQLFSGHDFSRALVSLVGVLVVLTVQHLVFQSSANLFVTGIAYSVTFLLTVSGAIALTGGWHSPVVLLLFCTPIIVFMISGYRAAFYSVVTVFFLGLVFMVLDLLQVSLPQVMHEENRGYVQGVIWFMACILLLVLFGTQKWMMGLDTTVGLYGNKQQTGVHDDQAHQAGG